MASTDLITLDSLKTWLEISTPDSARDSALSGMITSISRAILSHISRSSLAPRVITELYDGTGKTRMQLREFPVHDIVSLTIGSRSVSESSSVTQTGWVLSEPDEDPPGSNQLITLRGLIFDRGESNVSVSYLTGYLVEETYTVPGGGGSYTVQEPYGEWTETYDVLYSSQQSLVEVTGAPGTGQYSVADGTHTFAAGDAGKRITIQYGYVPAELAQAALEWAAYRWAAKDRAGVSSKSLGGQETVSFTNESVPEFVAHLLSPYTRVH